jgi:hypothetical protein
MSALDIIHEAVRAALLKDGWTITNDPMTLNYKDLTVFADLGAQRAVGAERKGERVVIEIKTLGGPSPVFEFERALGQYLIYRAVLSLAGISDRIYLAVSTAAFNEFFSRESIEMILKIYDVLLVVVDIKTQEIVKWTT